MSTAANAGAARGVAAARTTGGSQTTASLTFVDLVTVGPSVTLSTGTSVLVLLTAFITNTTAAAGGYMAYRISGSTTLTEAAERSLRHMNHGTTASAARGRYTAAVWQTGLTTGSNTFLSKYAAVLGGTADFDEREIAVLPLS